MKGDDILADFDRESMLEMFSFEMSQLVEQLEQTIIQAESGYSSEQVNEIFRIMHTIKGSAAMMLFDSISTTAHAIEDLFFYIREENPQNINYSTLTDFVLLGMDFIKTELDKIENGVQPDGDGTEIIAKIKGYLAEIKDGSKAAAEAKAESTTAVKPAVSETKNNESSTEHYNYTSVIKFEDGCEMENIRAYTLVHNFGEKIFNVSHIPEDVIDETSIGHIRKNGFRLDFSSKLPYDDIKNLFMKTVYLKELSLIELPSGSAVEEPLEIHKVNEPVIEEVLNAVQPIPPVNENSAAVKPTESPIVSASDSQVAKKQQTQHVISVNVSKLDQLLNLMGELVIAEAMVTQNPELENLELESFHKEAIQLRKIINDVQDTVMSMRMVPLSTTFFKMHRIVRDMCKQLEKDVKLEILGEETEVDKNIIEHISDPLMHIIRNSIDHGIEKPDDRAALGKPDQGVVILEAKNSGGDVLIIIKDDGAGLNKDRIMQKAKQNGLLRKPESDYTDKEICQFIFLPGFSTNEKVTSYSGRGVGMDVVSTNLEAVGGSVIVDSVTGEGSTFTLKIPLTLAIIEGMTIKMGGAKYTIPIISIKQSFKAHKESIFTDPSGNEMIQVRGEVYNLIRLYEFFNVESSITDPEDAIVIMLENGEQTVCIMVDELIGEQQVVVKTMPKYIKKVRGISGCTLLGNGDISLIIDVVGFFDK